MEQEPVYVPSDRLAGVCQQVLGRIYDARQSMSQEYIEARTQEYNAGVFARSKKRHWWTPWRREELMITPHGMENQVLGEMRALAEVSDEDCALHPMCQINANYLELEHQVKDAMIQCAMNESVAISAEFARGISHLGLPLDFMRRRTIGFLP